MKRTIGWTMAVTVVAGAIGLAAPSGAATRFGNSLFFAGLNAFEEVPTLSTPGNGAFLAIASPSGDELKYALRYSGLEGGFVLFAHIHLGRSATNGGIMVFLCSNVAVPVATPPCPAEGETVTGTLSATDVIGPSAQGIEPGEFAELVRALRVGAGYVNVHTDAFPSGEIRGQVW